MRLLESQAEEGQPGWSALRRFLPYLWPAGETALKARVIGSLLLVLISILITTLVMPLAFGAAVDRMTAGMTGGAAIAIALVVAYAAARFGGVLFDNVRNAIFERVGQDAERRLAETTFRHLHRLSLRFHLERRTGAVTKIVERGTKSIDMMLYFLLFNIAPTVIQLAIVMVMFWVKFGFGLVVATAVMVVAYIRFTRLEAKRDGRQTIGDEVDPQNLDREQRNGHADQDSNQHH